MEIENWYSQIKEYAMNLQDRRRVSKQMEMVSYTLNELSNKIDTWLDDRGITKNGTPMGQAIKTLEETTELLDAINHNDLEEVQDAIGDIYVTIRGVCKVMNLPFHRCVERAYNEIKDRRGEITSGGTFVKNE